MSDNNFDQFFSSPFVLYFFILCVLVLAVLFSLFWLYFKYNALKKKTSLLEKELSFSSNNLQLAKEEYQDLKSSNIRLEEKLKQYDQSRDEQRAWLEQAKNQFQSLASEALEGNNKQFVELAKAHLSKESEVLKGDFSQKQQAIKQMLEPLKLSLDEYYKQTINLDKQHNTGLNRIGDELKRVISSHQELSKQTRTLKNALKRPHIRGRWGEVQLANCVELAGMSEFADVSFQQSENIDDKQLRPDLVVKMPGNRLVIVDAKTPIDAFMRSIEVDTEEERKLEMQKHGQQVKDHVKKLSLKSYGGNFSKSADFTVMFLPNESFLYAAIETQSDLIEFALDKKILIATPPTFVGLLKVVHYGWQEQKLADNAEKISQIGKELHKRIADFVECYHLVGKSLLKASSDYEVGMKRLNSRLIPQAKKMEELGAKGKKDLPNFL